MQYSCNVDGDQPPIKPDNYRWCVLPAAGPGTGYWAGLCFDNCENGVMMSYTAGAGAGRGGGSDLYLQTVTDLFYCQRLLMSSVKFPASILYPYVVHYKIYIKYQQERSKSMGVVM